MSLQQRNAEVGSTPAPVVEFPVGDFSLSYRSLGRGRVEISYVLPETSHDVFVGLWSKMAFYVRTLVEEVASAPGRHTVVWDGLDQNKEAAGHGAYICRLSVDNAQGASIMIELTD